ncbi:kelch repeat-containing protein, partial [Acinetobacter baumannii]
HLADGRWLLVGGDLNPGQLRIVDAGAHADSVLASSLHIPRSGHSATLLPDGSVMIFGGVNSAGTVLADAERFDPANGRVTELGS